jgi:Small metal-binding protein
MKTLSYSLLAGLIFIACNYTLAYAAEDEHAKEAEQHLEKAIESGKTGDTKSEAIQTEEAEKDLIQENKEKPYTQPSKHITGENPKAEHDKAAFEDIEKAKAHAKKGHAKAAADSAKKAETHIQEKEQSK